MSRRGLLLLTLATLIIGALAVWSGPGSLRAILLFGLYAVPSNSILPLPHEPGLLYFALYAPAHWLAIAGAVGAAVAAYVDGAVVGWAFQRPRGTRLREARSWRALTRWLMRWPFAAVTLIAFTGVPPIQVVRVMVLATGYSRHRYAAALALGRLPRFWLLALFGQLLSPPPWLMTALTFGFIAWAGYLVLRSAGEPAALVDEPVIEPLDDADTGRGAG